MTKMDKLSEMAAREWRADARAAHDDPLLDCLVEITRLHGVTATAQALSAGLPLEEHKLTPALLPRAAARAQLSARVVKRTLESISQDLLPAILLLNGERACLLLKKDGENYVVSHPELGGSSMEMSAAELSAQYTGLVCFVRPQFRFDARAPEVAKVRERHWFWAAIMENRRLYRDALIAALLINVFAMAMPLFTMNVYDRVVPNNAVETLWVLAIGITLVVIFNMILSTARSHVVDSASKRVDVRLSAQIMERVLDLRMEGRPVSVGSFAANLRSFESIRDFIASATITTLVDLPFILLFLLALAWISPWMVLPPLVAIVLILLVSLAAQARMESLTMASYQASSQRNATLVEALTGLESVKTLNAQGSIQRNWERATEYIALTGGKLKLISSSTVGFVQAIQQLVSISVVIIGVYQAQESAISMGGIIAASMIAGRCLAPLGQVAGLLMQYQNARTSLGSIDNYMKLPIERPAEAEFLHRPVFHGGIEFRDVTFSYPGSKQPVLKKVSFKLKPGEKVGIIGRIGSGKTTLEKLALALYQPTEGAVLLDGVDVRQIDPADVRRAIGHVPQDPLLFYGSLKHNLAMGAPYADDASILAAANMAGVTDFANLHPDGFDMIIGERGESLSGGQRQSVAVARALINDPPILLLDEPSSNMDHQSEAQLRKRLGEASATKTILLVTHRTALLDLVDRLIVIDNGHIVADGPKEQVVEALRQGRVGRGS
ncbi:MULTISPECIES: type I secretion system permease/ATPase [Achromobacter]|uniref:Cyclolysin secretion/processing ATP-binding protein CyaB n=2 Tax=Alcaligenaceae TaxID=506 RepID=A0A424W408_ALCXX|nr:MULTISPECIES: type I secretion system permease/ATPase [Achromobacter]MBC9906316.1 type I secretion system permease/ATPase [Achromobacter xylosoxidans]MBD0872734.1 type I secretion system permease/ATPase [Achromobacter xylosoxidans]MDH1304815.1 type I secretion system permease/ATPase [Achromobacter sp. GD03932]QNP83957.1 type I secretion system permease/ATPase [Achromobacter xylosoxidans]RPJ87951.1 type I secretion system permease/ATPase [Achromobacter xylosoxidans]